ncbi:MAG: hypothetical protein K6A43_08765 [Treponema sp.]|nr:hypothetical protein [Treponema sp.]
MNKKSISLVAIAFLMSVSMFAAGYKVVSVTGKVTFESAPETWKNVSVGQELSASTVLNTSLNSSVVIAQEDGKEITIKAMQKGTVDSLVGVASNKGLKRTGGIKTSSLADDVEGTSKGTATASSRASEAKADLDWDD